MTSSSARPRPANRPNEPGVLLETKLYAPALRDELVRREGLVGLLADGTRARRLTLLSAPPGFGKTTLLAQWLGGDPESDFAWLTLDAEDDQPERLFAYVHEALTRVTDDARNGDRRGPHGVPALLNALAQRDRRTVLVLDDYHVLRDEQARGLVAFLVEHAPPTLHVVVSTRSDPSLPLGLLRARAELNELRAAELRMTLEEAREFLNGKLGLRLDAHDTRVLWEHTEGWPAGLYLAALSIEQHHDPSAFIAGFAGDNRHVVDYLGGEVLRMQRPRIRQFLLRTSVLERFSAPLCDAVLERAGSASLLEELERSNLFLVRLDDRGEWFRYHQLFAELLRAELAAADRGLARTLHLRAASWLGEHGLVGDAIAHAVAAGDEAGAVELISAHWLRLLDSPRLGAVQEWLDALGEERVAAEPRLALVAAWIAQLSMRGDDGDRWLALAELGDPRSEIAPGTTLEVGLLLLESCLPQRGIDRMLEAGERLLALGPELEPPLRQLAAGGLACARYYSGDRDGARGLAEESVRAAAESRNHLANVLCLSLLSMIETDDGAVARGRTVAERAQGLASRAGLDDHPVRGTADIALGRALARGGDLAAARLWLERGIELRRRNPQSIELLHALLELAPILSHQGDWVGVRAALREAAALASGADVGVLADRLDELFRRLGVSQREPTHLPQPLSRREVTVLRLLGGTLSRREIGQELGISTDTVKTHTRAIYRKLAVSSRGEAVDRARELGLKLY